MLDLRCSTRKTTPGIPFRVAYSSLLGPYVRDGLSSLSATRMRLGVEVERVPSLATYIEAASVICLPPASKGRMA
jgi:hypothetical protein